ncbi:exonuclease domain-containing protein [Nocardia sp. NBC_01388]|uniref:3'-5' exonuclease n=1 Tax=Nocardia sp. NBC_01388 TaxID=2903596 RepID=UPI00324AF535
MTPAPFSVPDVLRDKRIAVVDVEGNGYDDIIEIAVLLLDHPALDADSIRSWLVRPPRPIRPLVTRKVHGIRDIDLADCPPWSAVEPSVATLLSDRILVAHNASVEHRVLTAHLPAWRPALVLDTLRLAKAVWPGLPRYGLDTLIGHAGLDPGAVDGNGYHRAGYDTVATARLLCRLVEDAAPCWDDLVDTAALPEFVPVTQPEDGLW